MRLDTTAGAILTGTQERITAPRPSPRACAVGAQGVSFTFFRFSRAQWCAPRLRTSMAVESQSQAEVNSRTRLSRIRSSLKRSVEKLVTFLPLVKVVERARRRNVVILCYHNVVPDSDPVTGEAALHLPMATFRGHLDALERHFDICSLQEALRVDQVERPRRLRVAITFDDAYQGTLRVAIPELVRRGHPATIFAPSGLLGTQSFWWDAYDVAPRERSQTCLVDLKGVGEKIQSWARERGKLRKSPGPFQRPGTVGELIEASTHSGINVAVHTVGHPNLAELARGDVARELEECLEELRSMGIEPDPYVAYPYGVSSTAVRDVVRAGSWAAGLSIEGGSFRPGTQDPWRVPRVSVPSGASAENVLARVLGLIAT